MIYVVDDDEIALYAGFYDLPIEIDEFLNLYLRHQKYFTIFLVIMLILDTLFEVFSMTYKDETIIMVCRFFKPF